MYILSDNIDIISLFCSTHELHQIRMPKLQTCYFPLNQFEGMFPFIGVLVLEYLHANRSTEVLTLEHMTKSPPCKGFGL